MLKNLLATFIGGTFLCVSAHAGVENVLSIDCTTLVTQETYSYTIKSSEINYGTIVKNAIAPSATPLNINGSPLLAAGEYTGPETKAYRVLHNDVTPTNLVIHGIGSNLSGKIVEASLSLEAGSGDELFGKVVTLMNLSDYHDYKCSEDDVTYCDAVKVEGDEGLVSLTPAVCFSKTDLVSSK